MIGYKRLQEDSWCSAKNIFFDINALVDLACYCSIPWLEDLESGCQCDFIKWDQFLEDVYMTQHRILPF